MTATCAAAGEFCSATHPNECVDRQEGRYLAAVYRLRSGPDDPVRTGEVSDTLDVRPPSVTEMFARLADDGLVDYETYRGVRLTTRGETVARELAWRECTVRTFFASHLDVVLDSRTAYRIGYALPKGGVARITDLVDRQEVRCGKAVPDGNPRPFGG